MQSDTSFLIRLTFFECLKVLLIKLIATLMVSAKLATIGLVKNRYFEIKVMTSLLLSLSSLAKFCPKFFLVKSRILPQKSVFLRSALGSISIIWDWHEV